MNTRECYRFVSDDLTSENGEMSWRIGEWNSVSGKIACCSNGLHAALTPRDSLRNVYGRRWFSSEARGAVIERDGKFAASEMRLIKEIPEVVLQRFALWCAEDCLKYYEQKFPNDHRVSDCIRAAQDYLDGKIRAQGVIEKREAAGDVISTDANGAAGRAAAAAIAAAIATIAPNAAAWASAAAATGCAAHASAAAYAAALATVDALSAANNVATTAAAAVAADVAAAAARTAAAAGATAHAAAVAASRDVAPADTAADPYYSAYAAYSACAAGTPFYVAQDEKLSEMIAQHLAAGVQ